MASQSQHSSDRNISIQQTRKQLSQQSIFGSSDLKDTSSLFGKQNVTLGYHSSESSDSQRYQAAGLFRGTSPALQPYGVYNSPRQQGLNTSKSFIETPYGKEDVVLPAVFKGNPSGFSSVSVADLSNLTLMVEKDPEVSGSDVLFSSFKESLGLYPNAGQVFDLIACYETLCRDHIHSLLDFVNQVDPSRRRFQRTTKIINVLYQECYTWRLISSLIKDRLQTENEEAAMEQGEVEKLGDNFSSKLKAIERLFVTEPSIRYCQLIVDWLEKNAEDKINDLINTENIQFSSDSISWEHTLYNLSHLGTVRSSSTVTEMDPDAPIRQKRALADLDEVDEVRLLRFIFCYLRAGKLEEAKKICIKYGQSWRAATLDGWRLWHDPNFECPSENGEIELAEGNQFGSVWKLCCWKLSEEEGITQHEKAIYAALSGNLKQLLSVCESWEDCMWAYFKVLVDAKVEQELRVIQDPETEGLSQECYAETGNLTAHKIFKQMDSHQDNLIKSEGKESFHLFQKYLILNEHEELLNVIGSNLDAKEPDSAHMLRFMTHVLIFFQTVGLDIDEALYTRVLQSYIEVLITKKQGELVATYTAKLAPSIQVEIYSKFLEQIESSKDKEHFLQLAKDAGLDVKLITKTVVVNIRESNPDEMEMENIVTDSDKKKIEAIEWLIFEPLQRIDALIQANAMVRAFLASRKLDSAKEVSGKIPKDSIDVIHYHWEKTSSNSSLPSEYKNAIKEYLCTKAYLNAHDAFNCWFDHFSHQAPIKPPKKIIRNFKDQITHEENFNDYKGKLEMWKGNLNVHVQNVSDKIYNVLLFPEGWMADASDNPPSDSGRTCQMGFIRQLCLPMLCFILHTALHSSERYKECLQLADVVQSEQHKLYSVFRKDDLQQLLSLLKDSALCLLNQNKDSMGFEQV